MAKQTVTTKEFDPTNTGTIRSDQKDASRMSGNLDINGEKFKLRGSFADKVIELTVVTNPADENDPFATPENAGEVSLKQVTPNTDRSPSYAGEGEVDGKKYRVAGWKRTAKTGKLKGQQFIALAVQTEEQYEAYKARAANASAGYSDGVEKGASVKVDI